MVCLDTSCPQLTLKGPLATLQLPYDICMCHQGTGKAYTQVPQSFIVHCAMEGSTLLRGYVEAYIA